MANEIGFFVSSRKLTGLASREIPRRAKSWRLSHRNRASYGNYGDTIYGREDTFTVSFIFLDGRAHAILIDSAW